MIWSVSMLSPRRWTRPLYTTWNFEGSLTGGSPSRGRHGNLLADLARVRNLAVERRGRHDGRGRQVHLALAVPHPPGEIAVRACDRDFCLAALPGAPATP